MPGTITDATQPHSHFHGRGKVVSFLEPDATIHVKRIRFWHGKSNKAMRSIANRNIIFSKRLIILK
jgi:hypothetical protein